MRESFVLPDFSFAGESIVYAESARNLGLVFDRRLEWKEHVISVCSRIYSTLRKLKLVASFMPVGCKLLLTKALVLPLITYCDVVYCAASVTTLGLLRRAVNACIRFVYSLSYRDHVSQYYSAFLGCHFNQFFRYRVAVFMHKVFYGRLPGYLLDRFRRSTLPRRLGFLASRARTAHYDRSTIVRGPRIWNSLPHRLRSLRSEVVFRKMFLEFVNANPGW